MQKAAGITPVENPNRRTGALGWWGVGLLVVGVVAAYCNSLGVPFLLDDQESIVDNESVHRIGSWWTAFSPRARVYTAGRPLLNFSFALNYSAGGLSVTGYHVVNLLIHLAATLTLWAIVRRTVERCSRGIDADRVALVAALVWALHPIQTVCVTYLSQRAESLMALFYLLTLYCFIRATDTPKFYWKALAVASCAAGMMVKEVMVTAPLVVFLFDRTFAGGSFSAAWRARRGLHLNLAATWIVLAALMLGTRVSERGVGFGLTYGWFDYARIETGAVLHYLRLALWPFPLIFDYGQEVEVPGALAFGLDALLLAAILAAIIWALRRPSALGFLGCCFFLILAPTSSIVPVAGQPIAENRLYLPLAAVAVLIASSQIFLGRKAFTIGVTGALALGLLSIDRNQVYATEIGIWADTVAKRPQSTRGHANYGTALLRAKRNEGIRELETAIHLQPRYAFAQTNLACAYFEQQRFDDAIRHFQAALASDPSDPMTHSNYGAALFQVNRWEEALQQFLEALRLRPTHPASRVNAGILYARLGRPAEAIAMFEDTLQMYPNDAAARDNLAQLRAAIQSGTYKPAKGTP